ncbi:LytTR family DNA-binding domain-containing protein [Niabella sp.]|uniref:LytR/AlgR family response regulator transcription factor n=1 Tax=Niabella sp. TaxID=1962976 RepID=UPI002628E92D|nr:LytTR family DNA-binding domain-containing protein [Niabella sp.]
MNCIIIDDEPLAREGVQLLIAGIPELRLTGSFNNAASALRFLQQFPADLVFLDIEMPGMNGLELASALSGKTLVIFITAHTAYAVDSYELAAIDYLVKPIHHDRFLKAVQKAIAYHGLLHLPANDTIASVAADYIFVKSDRKYYKVFFRELLFIEGLKDYVVLYLENRKIITAMNIKTIHEQLPQQVFVRISKSYLINVAHITSFNNNSVQIREHEIPIGDAYRAFFFDEFVKNRLVDRG